ncbi:dihydrodipicolinate synthase family protein [Limibacillus sp. MBR-115]|jgi:4-hydroxy-tetrahydrodipicolinate synthase|uniref:dihydrodipicolinate synthase family protein n=1 Tax=Limibacillus sp. MBR-115 TaxID=3156465 RepID=UPI003392F1F8
MGLLDENTKGVFIIAVTPFKDDLSLDLASTDRLVDFYLERGVTGITVLGMMGEASKLAPEEALAFSERVIRRVNGVVPVVVGVSAQGFAQMRDLSLPVMEQGASGVMVAPSPGLKSNEQVLEYFRQVASTIGSDIPLVLQDFPLSTGVVMSTPVILQIVSEISNCVMLKHEDWPGLGKLKQLRDAEVSGGARRISILVGNGGIFLPEELERGADGAMTGFAFPEMLVEVCRLFEEGRPGDARDLFDAYLPLVRYEQQPGLGLLVRKHVLARRGAIASPIARKPAMELASVDINEIDTLIRRQEGRLSSL